jgi:hypothetical protein
VSRPRHPGKELEAVLQEAERKGWRITKGSKYYMMWCPCPGKHKKTVRVTPHSNYPKNLLGELRRKTCWDRTEPK